MVQTTENWNSNNGLTSPSVRDSIIIKRIKNPSDALMGTDVIEVVNIFTTRHTGGMRDFPRRCLPWRSQWRSYITPGFCLNSNGPDRKWARNDEIRARHQKGESIVTLAEVFSFSPQRVWQTLMIAGSKVATVVESLRPLTQEQRQVCDARDIHPDFDISHDRENASDEVFDPYSGKHWPGLVRSL